MDIKKAVKDRVDVIKLLENVNNINENDSDNEINSIFSMIDENVKFSIIIVIFCFLPLFCFDNC